MKLPLTFIVPWPPKPYISNWKQASWEKKKEYMQYTRNVRAFAACHGLTGLIADKDHPLHVHTRAYFANGRHGDPENIRKAIVDALFYDVHNQDKKRSSARDKYVGGAFSPPLYDKENPRTEVVIADGSLSLRDTIPKGW